MTVREHIQWKLKGLVIPSVLILLNSLVYVSDIQELSYIGKHDFGKFLGSTETYTREFRRMRTDGIIKVDKSVRKGRQQTWVLREIEF